MTTIVMNTMTSAVTEYGWTFQSITPEHAGDDNGLYLLGGDNDNGTAIAAEVRGGKHGGHKKMSVGTVWFGLLGALNTQGQLIVEGEQAEWSYPVTVRPSGVTRTAPGQGIRENYLALGYRNLNGADFRLDRIDAEIFESKQRRVG